MKKIILLISILLIFIQGCDILKNISQTKIANIQNVKISKNNEVNKIWKIATPPPNIKYINLDEETFFDALMEVIDG